MAEGGEVTGDRTVWINHGTPEQRLIKGRELINKETQKTEDMDQELVCQAARVVSPLKLRLHILRIKNSTDFFRVHGKFVYDLPPENVSGVLKKSNYIFSERRHK